MCNSSKCFIAIHLEEFCLSRQEFNIFAGKIKAVKVCSFIKLYYFCIVLVLYPFLYEPWFLYGDKIKG